jgi:hypothetical protein
MTSQVALDMCSNIVIEIIVFLTLFIDVILRFYIYKLDENHNIIRDKRKIMFD